MSPIFIKHFNKTAAPWSKMLAAIKHPATQTLGGLAGGAGLAYVEQSPSMTDAGREANLAVNLGAGLAMGNPWARQLLKKTVVNPVTGTEILKNDPKKWLGLSSILAAKTMGLKTWDQGNRFLTHGADASANVSKATEQLVPLVTTMNETLNGPGDVVTPDDVAKALAEGRAVGIKDYINLAVNKGQNLEKKITEYGAAASKELKDLSAGLSNNVNQIGAKFDDIGGKFEKALPAIESISNLAKWVPETAPKVVAAAAGAGALWGGYNLLRDYLNYNRIKKEREARMQPKLAAVPWGVIGKRVLPSVGLGAFEGAVNYELDPDHPALAVLAGTLGAASGANLYRGGGKLPGGGMKPLRFNPKGLAQAAGAAILPRSLAYLQSGTKENLAQASSHGATPANIALGVGGGALTVAALAALYQGARAAKQVAEGQPLVNATTSNTILSGSGGPDNPNFGGKMLVTLPTRNPGDRETTIELPLENVPLSDTLINRIRRDTKRRLRAETSTRTMSENNRSPEEMKQLMAVN